MVIIVTDKLCCVDPPTGDTLLWIVKLEVIPCVELNGKDLGDCNVTVLEATGASSTTATVIWARDGTESAFCASFVPQTVIVGITGCSIGDYSSTVT